jgi:tetratricopeptide (TPR) repeat protein
MWSVPDLTDGHLYETWLQTQHAAGTPLNDTVTLLADVGTPIATLRAATLALDLPGTDSSTARLLALRARLSDSRDVAAFADAVLAYSALRDARRKERASKRAGSPLLLPGLLATLESLQTRTKTSSLGLEAEAWLHVVIGIAYQFQGDFSAARQHSSQALLLAETLRLPITRGVAINGMACALIGLGNLNQSVGMLKEEVSSFNSADSPATVEELERFMADALFSLGNHQEAISILERLAYRKPHLSWPQPLASLFRCLIGEVVGDPTQDYEWAGMYRTVTEAVTLLVQVGGLDHRQAAERERALRRILDLTRPDGSMREPWSRVMEAWARTLAFYWLGEHGRAAATIRDVQVPPPGHEEYFDLRVLVSGLRLELALQLADVAHDSPRRCEDALRAVFKDASRLPHADPVGLAERLKRWHPLAAAYAAVMPAPIPVLADGVDMVLRLRGTSSAYGLPLPATYAVEIILRSLRLSAQHFVHAPLNKMQIAQRDALKAKRGGVSYWRPVIPGAHLAFGLLKSGEGRPEYLQAAQGVAADFGIVPITKAAYGQAQIEVIHIEMNRLLSGEGHIRDIAEALLRLPSVA